MDYSTLNSDIVKASTVRFSHSPSRRAIGALTAVLAATTVVLGGSLGVVYYQGITTTNSMQNQLNALQNANNQQASSTTSLLNAILERLNGSGYLYTLTGVVTIRPGDTLMFFGPNGSKNVVEGGYLCSKTIVDPTTQTLCAPVVVTASIIVDNAGSGCVNYFNTVPTLTTQFFNFAGERLSGPVVTYVTFEAASDQTGLSNSCGGAATLSYAVVIESPYPFVSQG